MEYLMAGEFWREVGLTVAARLSVVAVALWAVKMVTDHLKGSALVQPVPAGVPTAVEPPPTRMTNAVALEQPGGQNSRGGVRRKLFLKKTESEAWREKMGKYLSGEPVVTSTTPRRQR